MENILSDNLSSNLIGISDDNNENHPLCMGQEITSIVTSGFRNTRGEKSADPVMSDPRNNILPPRQNGD